MKFIILICFSFMQFLTWAQDAQDLDISFRKHNKAQSLGGPESIIKSKYGNLLVTSVGDAKIYQLRSKVVSKSLQVFADFHQLKNWKKTDRIVGMHTDPDGNIFVVSPDYAGGSIFLIYHDDLKGKIHQVVKGAGRLNDIFIDHESGVLLTTRQDLSGEVQKYNLQSLYYHQMGGTIHKYDKSVNHLAEITMPNGVTVGHRGKVLTTSTGMTNTEILEIDLKSGNKQVFKKLGMGVWADGLIYSKRHQMYLVTDNKNGTIESFDTKGKTFKKLNLLDQGQAISPAEMFYDESDGYLYVSDLWKPSMMNLLKYEYSDKLDWLGDDYKKENIHTYHDNIYVLFEEEIF